MKPRLVKEIRLAKERFSEITLVSFLIENWTDKVHLELCQELGIKHYEIYATRKHLFSWLIGSLLQRAFLFIWPLAKSSLPISAFASNKRTFQLFLAMHKLKGRFDLVNGRNTATLYPLYYLHRKRKCNVSFDIEDFHPGEKVSWSNPAHERLRRELLMKRILPVASLVTTAGNPILNEVKKLFPDGNSIKLVSVDNSFSSSEFVYRQPTNNSRIKFVWYSVDISRNRGLETFLPILSDFSDKVSITLIGSMIPEFHHNFLKKYQDFIEFVDPMPQNKLHKYLSEFDIGLAIETNKLDINKQLAVSNKIYAYTQAGLFVLATSTIGQTEFMTSNKYAGVLIDEDDHRQIREKITSIINNIAEIREKKHFRFNTAKSISRENQSGEVAKYWDHILNEV